MISILHRLYGRQGGDAARERLAAVMDAFAPERHPGEKDLFAPTDAILITYGDTLFRSGERPLKTLNRFSSDYFRDVFSGIHILPFFPYSSDDGFSVTDFHSVRPDLGSWADIRAIGKRFRLMVDLVANHVSAKSRWFQAYLADKKGFDDLAIEVDPSADLSAVIRPRALPLLTAYTKGSGRTVHLWTTFSADQIDLNYRSIDVLENMVRTLLFYVSQGARMIRLDAIAYLWKQIGTPCIHLHQTHDLVRLFRRVLNRKAPGVVVVTETNVPHDENISYFGDGSDQAQMVYNFTLPPLLLYSLATGKARVFSDWAQTLVTPSTTTAFLNFSASHDGIGVRPLEGILPSPEIAWLADRTRKNGGRVSEKRNPDGSNSPYELNITYLDALKDPSGATDPHHIPRFLASQAVVLVLPGVPAVYIHSLLGSTNWTEGMRATGQARTINRARLPVDALVAELDDPHSVRSRIFFPYLEMIRIRCRQPAFHPGADMQILHLDDRVFAVQRTCREQVLVAVTNFSAASLTVGLPTGHGGHRFRDLLSGQRVEGPSVTLRAYQSVWLAP
ncbi:sucrose phosphorylase [Desulfosarcina alkanivorans]|uniref:Sucrose phosphorylase n=1 Tax=Desulfosarcina alkanivorans TaxID=571177 RepID=A0A5K7YL01_9BACT|nr:alpha-amylase family glycosyl hydrolase [Desulfosarcina alkanivorans]BBO66974.1 sucrose phosphorylase [Desulfosarcina alkanivorans]